MLLIFNSSLEQSDRTGVPGTRITLGAEVRLPPDVHVYAPGAQGYKPIQLLIDQIPEMQLKPAIYPQSKTLFLPVIKERVPVFDGTFRISQDVKVSSGWTLPHRSAKTGKHSPSRESWSIRLATKPSVICPRPFQ